MKSYYGIEPTTISVTTRGASYDLPTFDYDLPKVEIIGGKVVIENGEILNGILMDCIREDASAKDLNTVASGLFGATLNGFDPEILKRVYEENLKVYENTPKINVLIFSVCNPECYTFLPNGEAIFTPNGAFVNVSNHTFEKWSAEQQEAAEEYGSGNRAIIDVPFPNIDPEADSEEIKALADKFARYANRETVYMVQGESCFTFALVSALKEKGCAVVAATTRRESVETVNPDGTTTKKSVFKFAKFREY